MHRLILLLPLLALGACTQAVSMQNSAIGLTKLCGPKTEAQCISDLEAQGYKRVEREWKPWSAL
jgi:hypothetical protein